MWLVSHQGFVFQVANSPDEYWDGKIAYRRRTSGRRKIATSKVLEDINDEWVPKFSTSIHVEHDPRKAKRLMMHYTLQQIRHDYSSDYPDLIMRSVVYEPQMGKPVDTITPAQLIEAQRLEEKFGGTLAESYGRLDLPADDIIMEVAVKRKGGSISTARGFEKAFTHGNFSFFRTKAHYVHARLKWSNIVERVYYLQE